MNIRKYLENHRILTDGAMGTYFDIHEEKDLLCSEEANIMDPELILKIHENYIEHGAQLIRSNTFMANEDTLAKIKLHNKAFDYISLKDFIKAGYRIALKAQENGSKAGKTIYVAANIGPLVESAECDREDLLKQYYEICDAFLEEGAQSFVLETFPDEYYVLKMASYIRKKSPESFILGQFTFMPTGYSSTGFHYSTVLNKAIESGLLDTVGLNCGIGASHMEQFIRAYLADHPIPETIKFSALPNCGYPKIVRGKAVYSDSLPYFSDKLKEIAKLGVNILGGCCGTNPEYIGAIDRWIHDEKLVIPKKIILNTEKRARQIIQKNQNTFGQKLMEGQKVFAVELDPPFDADDSRLMEAAKVLIGSKADIITISDSPLARSRADSLMMAAKLKRETGMQVMPHLSCRDRNRIAMRGGILGAYLNEIRNYLFVTGDPVSRADQENTKSVFDFNSIRCMRFVKHMNESIFEEDPVIYGGALNQDGVNLKAIAGRMEKKMAEGCQFFMTQPVYSMESIEKLRKLKEMTGARLLVGILPLVSYRNALFMKNEMPGIYVSDEVVAMYKEEAGREEWEKIAIAYSLQMMKESEEIAAGYYMMTPFNRVSLIKEILKQYEE